MAETVNSQLSAGSNVSVARTGAGLLTLIAAAVAAVAPVTGGYEGEKHRVYLDPVGIPTVCDGETQHLDLSKVYTHGECQAMLRTRMARDYAPKIIACVPAFAKPENIGPLEASIDASYNAGPGGFCRSPMARAFNAGNWGAGCAAFVGWKITARGQRLPGLVTRRMGERKLCEGK